MKQLYTLLIILGTIFTTTGQTSIPLGGNAFVTKGSQVRIGKNGIENWNNPNTIISTWFKTSSSGILNLSLKAKADGEAIIKLIVEGKSFITNLSNSDWNTIPVGTIQLRKSGYIKVDLQGIKRAGDIFAEVSDIIIEGEAASEPLNFVRNPENFYFGRRGPSVHLSYDLPTEHGNIEYFYNEITVRKGQDVIGSYYMANGFAEGYFGIQVNSEKERRVLFSVWSPFKTDNPKEIPEDQRIKLLGKGPDVVTNDFGGEGSGGQSFLRFSWEAGLTYKFLTQIHPDTQNQGSTIYSSWFFDPEKNDWRLIASFSRPKTVTWYKRPYSFLENFIPTQGYIARQVEFSNQWAVTEQGEWIELTKAKFTHDATASAKLRMDYTGGLIKGAFFLKNCGFFNENIPTGTYFERKPKSVHPNIDLSKFKSDSIILKNH